MTLNDTMQHYTTVYNSIQHYTTVYNTIQHYIRLYGTIRHCTNVTRLANVENDTRLANES